MVHPGSRPAVTPARTPKKSKRRHSDVKDPVEVLCRVRPLPSGVEESCIRVIDEKTVLLHPPEQSRAWISSKELQYTFNKVFEETIGQTSLFRTVGLPLVDDLIRGKNGLLFTYGITGSGKTYTVTGTPQDGGLLPRSLDVIFNSIGDFQAKKYVFKPDRQNGFDIQSEVDAMLERQQRDIMPTSNNHHKLFNGAKEAEHLCAGRVPDPTRLEEIDEDNAYAVFVSYCEIYNNYVYDLLEEPQQDQFGRNKPPQTKKLREDAAKVMYVENLLEVEVKSTEEAYEVLLRGDKNRRKAQTVLNHESSRSHSVFNIRLAQAPLDPAGEEVLMEKSQVCVSQLSLVDLAGSERQDRTKSAGDRLKEAGQINNSLMTLRTCIEILRDNQRSGASRMVPYRDSRVTHLFKNFFDGEGKVKMIVCLNPMAADYDETLHVMKFAEMTQEVQTTRATGVKYNLGLTPGRRKANLAFKAAIEEDSASSPAYSDPESLGTGLGGIASAPPLAYDLGAPLTVVDFVDPRDERYFPAYIDYFMDKARKRATLLSDLGRKYDSFRARLVEVEAENLNLRAKQSEFQTTLQAKDKELQKLRKKLQTIETSTESLKKNHAEALSAKRDLESELESRAVKIKQEKDARRRLQEEMASKMALWEKHMNSKYTTEMRRQAEAHEAELRAQEERMEALREIVNSEDPRAFAAHVGASPSCGTHAAIPVTPKQHAAATPATPKSHVKNLVSSLEARGATPGASSESVTSSPSTASSMAPSTMPWAGRTRSSARSRSPPPGVASGAGARFLSHVNTRRRSKSTGPNVWVDHRPSPLIETDDIMRPTIPGSDKRRKSNGELPVKEVEKANKYMMTTQLVDSEGEIETRVVKGDIVPTRGGGSEVKMTDVEIVRRRRLSPVDAASPNATAPKRSYSKTRAPSAEDREEVEERCAIAIEGHGGRRKSRRN